MLKRIITLAIITVTSSFASTFMAGASSSNSGTNTASGYNVAADINTTYKGVNNELIVDYLKTASNEQTTKDYRFIKDVVKYDIGYAKVKVYQDKPNKIDSYRQIGGGYLYSTKKTIKDLKITFDAKLGISKERFDIALVAKSQVGCDTGITLQLDYNMLSFTTKLDRIFGVGANYEMYNKLVVKDSKTFGVFIKQTVMSNERFPVSKTQSSISSGIQYEF